MRAPQQEITEMLKQNKANSWTPVGPLEPEHQLPTDLLKKSLAGAMMHVTWCNVYFTSTNTESAVFILSIRTS